MTTEPTVLNAFHAFVAFAEALDAHLMDDDTKATFTPFDEWRACLKAFEPLFDRETRQ